MSIPYDGFKVTSPYYRIRKEAIAWVDVPVLEMTTDKGERKLFLTYELIALDEEAFVAVDEEELTCSANPSKMPIFAAIAELGRMESLEEFKHGCVRFCSEYCCLMEVKSVFAQDSLQLKKREDGTILDGSPLYEVDHERSPHKTSLGSFFDWRKFTENIAMVLGDFEMYQSAMQKIELLPVSERAHSKAVQDPKGEYLRYKSATFNNLSLLLKEYPTRIEVMPPEIDSEKTTPPFFFQSFSNLRALVVYQLARHIVGEEKFFRCAKCGRYGRLEFMSRMGEVSLEEREYLKNRLPNGFPLSGPIWLHQPTKSDYVRSYDPSGDTEDDVPTVNPSTLACYSSIYWILRRRKMSIDKGREPGKWGSPIGIKKIRRSSKK